MKRQVTPLKVSAAVILGLLFSKRFPFPLPIWLLLLTGFSVASFVFHQQSKYLTLEQPCCKKARLFFYFACFSLAACRQVLPQKEIPLGDISCFISGTPISFRAKVREPFHGSAKRRVMRVEVMPDKEFPNAPNSGMAELVFLHAVEKEPKYGDVLQITGIVREPPDSRGSFSYRESLQRDGVFVMLYTPKMEIIEDAAGFSFRGMLYELKTTLCERVKELFPKYENTLMEGILLGNEDDIPSDIEKAFQQTGTSHIIAISGSNFSLICFMLMLLLRRLIPNWKAVFLTIPLIFVYAFFVGASPAVMRAAVMSSFSIVARSIGREGFGINSLAVTAALMLFVHPDYAENVGFLLSVSATLGIFFFTEPLTAMTDRVLERVTFFSTRTRKRISDILSDWVWVSVSAQCLTLWISAAAFGKLPLVSIPANFAIAPFQSVLMLGGMAALLLSYVYLPLGKALAWLIWAAPAATIRFVQFFAEMRIKSLYLDLSLTQGCLMVALISLVWCYRNVLFRNIHRKLIYYALGVEISAALWVALAVFSRCSQNLTLTILGGEPIFEIQTSRGRRGVIAETVTNYRAQELFDRNLFTEPSVNFAWLNFSEGWMAESFRKTTSSIHGDLLILNDVPIRFPADAFSIEKTEISLNKETFLEANGMKLRILPSYLGKRACLVEYGSQRILLTMGVPAKRIFSESSFLPEELTLIVVGGLDDKEAWTSEALASYCDGGSCEAFPPVYDVSEIIESKIYSDGESFWITEKTK